MKPRGYRCSYPGGISNQKSTHTPGRRLCPCLLRTLVSLRVGVSRQRPAASALRRPPRSSPRCPRTEARRRPVSFLSAPCRLVLPPWRLWRWLLWRKRRNRYLPSPSLTFIDSTHPSGSMPTVLLESMFFVFFAAPSSPLHTCTCDAPPPLRWRP